MSSVVINKYEDRYPFVLIKEFSWMFHGYNQLIFTNNYLLVMKHITMYTVPLVLK